MNALDLAVADPVTVVVIEIEDPVAIKAGVSIKPFPIVQALIDYQRLNRSRFHIPGHGGQMLCPVPGFFDETYAYDLTEVEGLDVLSEPNDCIRESQERAAQLFGVRESFYLVNGSSVGLQAALLSVLQPGDEVLLPRNVHRSVISGLILTGAKPIWMLPEWLADWGLWAEVCPEAVGSLLKAHPNIKALVVTSPTYEGIASDIKGLADVCHSHGVRLLVDEAHGSLWPFSEDLPRSACHQSCDFVVHSLHKSAGSLTQSAIAHLPNGSKIDPALFQQALNTLQTTSPSYLLLASLDATCAFWEASEASQPYLQELLKHVHWFRKEVSFRLTAFSLYEHPQRNLWDPSQLYFRSRYEGGEAWACRLESQSQIAFEKTDAFGTLYKAGIGLKRQDYECLLSALLRENEYYDKNSGNVPCEFPSSPITLFPQVVLSPREAFFAPGEAIPREQGVGRIAKETHVHCPPGIPVLIAGEMIQREHEAYLPESVLVVRA